VGNEGLVFAKNIYEKAKSLVGKIEHIYTDGNSCYEKVFRSIPEPHTITKSQTHLIESSNSSIRDNLARFNRRTKRYSKSLEMLMITMDLFINKHLFDIKYEIIINIL
jgi:IS1 family transposase